MIMLMMVPAVGLGLGRFAYGMILPDMRVSLDWSYTVAGWINALNAFGYLVGAALTPRLMGRLGAMRATILGTFLVVAGIALTGLSGSLAVICLARLVAGFGAAMGFVGGGTLSVEIAETRPERRSFLIGLFYAGPGLGILAAGLMVPGLMAVSGPGSWATAWLLLAAIGIVLVVPLATGERRRGVIATAAPVRPSVRLLPMLPLLVGYFSFGAGYIGYMTFMNVWSRNAGLGTFAETAFWMTVGAGVMASPWLWSGLIDRFSGGRNTGLMIAITGSGALIPLAAPGLVGLLLSAALFGSAFMSVVASTTTFVRRHLPVEARAAGVAAMTITFGLGQVAGPVVIGFASDLAGSLDLGLWLSAGILIAGALLSTLQGNLAPDGAAPAPVPARCS
ncbi:YbfB/YjiJ family MFS transporter [Segnochrobactraceae bacterium EtOH-i3]